MSPITKSTKSIRKSRSRDPSCTSTNSKKNVLYIKNFRGCSRLGPDHIERELNRLEKEINLVVRDQNPTVALQELYYIVENLVDLEYLSNLIPVLKSVNEKFLSEKLEELLLVGLPSILFEHVTSFWKYYWKKIVTIKNIFLCYERSLKNDFKVNMIQTICVKLFTDIIILNPVVSSRLSCQLLKVIAAERHGEIIDRNEIKTVLSMLTDLDYYMEVFEKAFFEESKQYFQKEGCLISNAEISLVDYSKHVQKRIEEEESRSYLPRETIAKVLRIIYSEMIEEHLEEILCKGFQKLIDNKSTEDLIRLYNLFIKVPVGMVFLGKHFEKYVLDRCSSIVGKATDKTMIQDLIDLKQSLDKIIDECFKKNKTFNVIVKNVFGKQINFRNIQSAHYLAKYLDAKLRSKYISEEELETTFDKVMVIFRYIHGKDVFEAFYRKYLSKRLIFDKSTNQDIEHYIILKLKEQCGDGFTTKLEGMLRDINLSRSINSNFKEYLVNAHQNLLEKSDVSISVLTRSYWTSATTNLDVNLPDDLLKYQWIFGQYYIFIHTGRKLDWQANLGHCVVRATFANTVKELQVSLFQTIVLLLFNGNDRLTSTEIQEMTKLEPKELIVTLHSLACGKTRILLKEPEENTVTMDDVFQFNHDFTDKLFRIKINQVQLKETADEQKATEKSILADRQFQIDAAIVQILRRKRVINHNDLISEVFNVLDIPVLPQDLKKRIELLVETKYIKRSSNAARYTYIA